ITGLELVRDSPVEEEHVEARLEEILHHAAARPEVEDVRPAHQAHDEEERRLVSPLLAVEAPQLHFVAAPDRVLRRAPEIRATDASHVLDAVLRSQYRALDVTPNASGEVAGAEHAGHVAPLLDRRGAWQHRALGARRTRPAQTAA